MYGYHCGCRHWPDVHSTEQMFRNFWICAITTDLVLISKKTASELSGQATLLTMLRHPSENVCEQAPKQVASGNDAYQGM